VGVEEKGAEGRNLNPQRKEVKGNWSKLHNRKHYDLYSTPNTHYSDEQMIEGCDGKGT
jgi:hypothetical protein